MYVRKNAATLTDDEWQRLNDAIVVLKHTFPPGSDVSIYDQFVAIHLGVTELISGPQAGIDGGHGGPAFLPWHREYIRRYENALQAVDPRVSLPYWNWGLGPEAETTALFQDNTMGPAGSGGASGFEVMSGYFAQAPNNAFNPLGWTIRPELRPLGPGLQRNRTLNTSALPSATPVGNALAETQYHNFRPALERSPLHNFLHGWVGRDMARMTSPNDPIFFLHHCQVDRIWAIWQRDHPGSANYNPLGTGGSGHRLNDWIWPWDGGASAPNATLTALIPTFASTDRVRPADVLDHRTLGYCYDDEPDCPCPAVPGPTVPGDTIHGEANPDLLIPDNRPEGVVSFIDIPNSGRLTDITVSVDITHTWRGDLEVTLIAPGNFTALLKGATGEPGSDLRQTYRPSDTPALASLVQGNININGRWSLHVVDRAQRDVGRLVRWSLDLQAN